MPESIPTSLPELKIRFATIDDAPLVLDFIRELAAYEKLADAVTADIDTLRASLFGEKPAAEVVLADWRGEPQGFALFFPNFSTFLGRPGIFLEDLYVRPEMRGKGIGRALLAFLAGLAGERGCGRLEWSVLNWNKPAIGFYKGLGAVPMEDWTVYRVAGAELAELAGKS